MTKEEVQKLQHGVYRIYWKLTDSKYPPYSLAAVGSDLTGNRWFSPCNWVTSKVSQDWLSIDRVELIEEMNYDKKPQNEDLTPTGNYKIQIAAYDLLHIKGVPHRDANVVLSLSKLLGALWECGYKIEEPPSKSFTELKTFLDEHDYFQLIDSLGSSIFTYYHNVRDRRVSITQANSHTEVSIFIRKDSNDAVFVGRVESLDEFKLIWNRII